MPHYVDMYVARASWPSSNGKSYQSIYLRESYRDGPRVRKRDIANLTHCDPKEIAAIELALRFKDDLAALGSLDKVRLSQGLSVGAVWTAFQTARRLGIDQALARFPRPTGALAGARPRARSGFALVRRALGPSPCGLRRSRHPTRV